MVNDGSICGAGFLIFSRGCEAPLSLFPLLKLSNPVNPSKPVSPVRCPLLRAYGGAKRSSVGKAGQSFGLHGTGMKWTSATLIGRRPKNFFAFFKDQKKARPTLLSTGLGSILVCASLKAGALPRRLMRLALL